MRKKKAPGIKWTNWIKMYRINHLTQFHIWHSHKICIALLCILRFSHFYLMQKACVFIHIWWWWWVCVGKKQKKIIMKISLSSEMRFCLPSSLMLFCARKHTVKRIRMAKVLLSFHLPHSLTGSRSRHQYYFGDEKWNVNNKSISLSYVMKIQFNIIIPNVTQMRRGEKNKLLFFCLQNPLWSFNEIFSLILQ